MDPAADTEELERVPALTVVRDGLWVVRIPLRERVEPVNAYVGRDGDGGLVVVDTGIATGAEELWPAVLDAIGHTVSDVSAIVVTHHHPDHIGGSGVLHRLSGAPVLGSPSTIEQAPDVWGDDGRIDAFFALLGQHLRSHGLPDGVARELSAEVDVVRAVVDLPPATAWRPLVAGDQLSFAGTDWAVHDTPGHADGHLVLHSPATRTLLAADHLLERISPAVGRFPGHAPDPLGNYLRSLRLVAELDVEQVLPGHGAPFGDARGRVDELVRHHRERVDACIAAAAALDRPTTFEVARTVFAKVFAVPAPDPADQRFATTETLAHLEHARLAGRLAATTDDAGMVRWHVA